MVCGGTSGDILLLRACFGRSDSQRLRQGGRRETRPFVSLLVLSCCPCWCLRLAVESYIQEFGKTARKKVKLIRIRFWVFFLQKIDTMNFLFIYLNIKLSCRERCEIKEKENRESEIDSSSEKEGKGREECRRKV